MAQSEVLDEAKWTPQLEVALFHSMHGLKPVGLNKNFHMVCIQHKLQQLTGLLLTTKQIWQHLRTLYDLDSLESLEMFPVSSEEKDFNLPADMLDDRRSTLRELDGGDEEGGISSRKTRLHSTSLSPSSSPAPGRSGSKRRKN